MFDNFIGANTKKVNYKMVIYMFDNFIGANTKKVNYKIVIYMFDNFIGANTKKVNSNTLVEQKPKCLKLSNEVMILHNIYNSEKGVQFKKLTL